MLSAIILAPDPRGTDPASLRPQEAVARTLAGLVSATVADLVRDATIAGLEGSDLARLADQAGCWLVSGTNLRSALAQALRSARYSHVLVLLAGFVPEAGFIDETEDFLLAAGVSDNGAAMQGAPQAAALRRQPEGFWQRVIPALAPVAGIIAASEELQAVASDDLTRMARALSAASFKTPVRRVV